MTGRPRSAGSAIVVPSASGSSASAAGAAPCSGTRFSPATRSSSVAPPAGAAASKASASAASIGGRIAAYRTRARSRSATAPPGRSECWGVWGAISGSPISIAARHGSAGARRALGGVGAISGPPLMTDPGSGDRLADVEGREEELELGVLDGVGGQHVGPERRHAPLEALAHVPDLVAVGAKRRKMPRQPLGDVGQPAAAEELVRAALGRVAVGAGVVALAHAPVEGRFPALDGRARGR